MSAVNNQGWIASMNAWLRQPGQNTQANVTALRDQAKAIGVDPGAIGDGAPEPGQANLPQTKADGAGPASSKRVNDAPPPDDSGDIDSIGPAKPKPAGKKTYVPPEASPAAPMAPPAAPVAPSAAPVAPPSGEAPPKSGGGFSTEAQTSKKSPEETKAFAAKLIDHLQGELGITKNQATGIVANLMHESAGLNPGMNQGMVIGEPSGNMADDNANGYGLAQWGGVRKKALIDTAGQQGIPPSSEKANVDFLVHELKGEYSGVISELKTKHTVAEATESFCVNYEKPSDPQLHSRIEAAHQIA